MLLLMKILMFANFFSKFFKRFIFCYLVYQLQIIVFTMAKINRKDLVTFNTEFFVVLCVQNLQNLLQFAGIKTIMS